jgi:hypothetical protein
MGVFFYRVSTANPLPAKPIVSNEQLPAIPIHR